MTFNSTGLRVDPIPFGMAVRCIVAMHYLRRRPPVSFAFGLFDKGMDLRGVVTLGTPPSRQMMTGACPSEPSAVIELNRLWVCDSMGRNTESWFVSRVLGAMPPRIVLSYADTARGHVGIIYRACNFFYAGWTDMERKTPRLDYVPATRSSTDLFGTTQSVPHSRDAFRGGFVERVRREPKVKYWTTTGSPKHRRDLRRLCAWPVLSWKDCPPPSVAISQEMCAV